MRKFFTLLMFIGVFAVSGNLHAETDIPREFLFGGSQNDKGYAIKGTSDGGFILAGESNNNGASNYDIVVIKIDGAGNILWQKYVGSPLREDGRDVIETSDGGFVVVGMTLSQYSRGYNE